MMEVEMFVSWCVVLIAGKVYGDVGASRAGAAFKGLVLGVRNFPSFGIAGWGASHGASLG
jgi:hypothetical protein